MGRRILAVLFLVALGAAVWLAVRWIAARSEVEATIIFDRADELVAGNHVVAGPLVIGRVTEVTPIQGKHAVGIRIDSEHRDRLLVDSRFDIEGERPGAVLRVRSTFAFGRPVRDGEVLYARESKIAGWLGEKGTAILGRIRDEADRIRGDEDLQRRLDEWSREIPEWKKAGDEVMQRNLETIGEKVDDLERKLRRAGKELDAERVRKEFEAWAEGVRERIRDGAAGDPATP